jgi:hypothetical protein
MVWKARALSYCLGITRNTLHTDKLSVLLVPVREAGKLGTTHQPGHGDARDRHDGAEPDGLTRPPRTNKAAPGAAPLRVLAEMQFQGLDAKLRPLLEALYIRVSTAKSRLASDGLILGLRSSAGGCLGNGRQFLGRPLDKS